MAAASRDTDRPLSAQLRSDPTGFEFYQLVRLLRRERTHEAGLPPIERAVRFRSDLSLVFPAHEVTAVADRNDAPVAVTTPDYGVGGYLGPLPESFTEWAQARRADGDPAMADFLDIFSQRINVLRYQIKARVHTALDAERPERTAQAARLAAITGMREPELVSQLPVTTRALLGLAGVLANRRRSAAAVEQVLRGYLGANVHVLQFQGAWQRLARRDQTRLAQQNSRLGRDMVLGQRSWDQSARIEVRIGPLPFARFRELLPGGARHAALVAMLRFLTDRTVDCRVRLQLDGDPPPSALTSDPAHGVRLAQVAWLPPAQAGEPPAAAFLVRAYDTAELDDAA